MKRIIFRNLKTLSLTLMLLLSIVTTTTALHAEDASPSSFKGQPFFVTVVDSAHNIITPQTIKGQISYQLSDDLNPRSVILVTESNPNPKSPIAISEVGTAFELTKNPSADSSSDHIPDGNYKIGVYVNQDWVYSDSFQIKWISKLSGNVSILGTAGIGQTLSANISNANATLNMLDFQWTHQDSDSILGHEKDYLVKDSDAGKRLVCKVVAKAQYQNILTDYAIISPAGDVVVASSASPEQSPAPQTPAPDHSSPKSDNKGEANPSDSNRNGLTIPNGSNVPGVAPQAKKPEEKKQTQKELPKQNRAESKEVVKTPVTSIFTDIAKDAWYEKPIQFVYDKGWMTGSGKDTFSPNQNASRGQIITILYRMAGSPKIEFNSQFEDVMAKDYFANAIAWAVQNKIASGYGAERFGANDNITREQFVVLLYRMANDKKTNATESFLESFKDKNDVSSYALEAFNWTVSKGIINGEGSQMLSPKGNATRSQIAAIFMRYSELTK